MMAVAVVLPGFPPLSERLVSESEEARAKGKALASRLANKPPCKDCLVIAPSGKILARYDHATTRGLKEAPTYSVAIHIDGTVLARKLPTMNASLRQMTETEKIAVEIVRKLRESETAAPKKE